MSSPDLDIELHVQMTALGCYLDLQAIRPFRSGIALGHEAEQIEDVLRDYSRSLFIEHIETVNTSMAHVFGAIKVWYFFRCVAFTTLIVGFWKEVRQL